MSLLESVKQFLNYNQNLLNKYDFNAIYSSAKSKLYDEEVGLMTNILLKARINPLDYLDHVPDLFLYEQADVKNIEIPNNITSIGVAAFDDCCGFTSVKIPNNVTSIGDFAFRGCSGLTSIMIPDKVTSIGYGAFKYCSNLTSVTISDSVTFIGNWAFEDCSKLTSIVYKGTMTDWKKIDKGSNWKYDVPKTHIIHCIDGDTKI